MACCCRGAARMSTRPSTTPANTKRPRPQIPSVMPSTSCWKHAYEHRKPILGICYGLQSLNVHCRGSLVQHIPDFLAREDQNVNHAAGRKEKIAHEVAVDPASKLASIVGSKVVPVNSSHHQAADKPGAGLRVVAQSTADGIIEALEGTAPDHFVMAVQWHPERSVE